MIYQIEIKHDEAGLVTDVITANMTPPIGVPGNVLGVQYQGR